MDVTVVGSINTDLVCYCQAFPLPGETINGTKFATGFGGKGANQCVAARKLGAETSLISRVGNDSFGKKYLKYLKKVGVETSTVGVSDTANSGVAVITVEQINGNNEIVIVAGANEEISVRDIEKAIENGQFSKKVLICQFEANAEATLYAMETAKRNGVLTMLDPAPAPTTGSPFLPLMKRFLASSSIVCPNETEAAVLTGIPAAACVEMAPDAIAQSAVAWLLALFNEGVTYPMVTLGVNGSVCLLPKSEGISVHAADVKVLNYRNISDDQAIFHIRAPVHVKALDTTGAGDCFAGSLGFFISKYPNLSMVEKIRRSVWIASQSVLRLGTQSSFQQHKELPKTLFDHDGEFLWPS